MEPATHYWSGLNSRLAKGLLLKSLPAPQGHLGGARFQVFLVAVNDPDLAGADFSIDTREWGGRRKRTGRERAAQAALAGSNMFM
jgi:hypothetical protein